MARPLLGGEAPGAPMPRESQPDFTPLPAGASEKLRPPHHDAWTEEPGSQAAARLRAVIANAPVILFAFDRNGIFTLSDGSGLASLELTPGEIVGRSAFALYGDMEMTDERGLPVRGSDAMERALSGVPFAGECRLRDRTFDFRLMPQREGGSGGVTGVVGVATDVTRRARAEQELRDAEERLLIADRLAGIGTLAAGAAHEINNPLTYALMNVDHVLRRLRTAIAAGSMLPVDTGEDELPSMTHALSRAVEGMQRVRGIVRNLLTFSQGGLEPRSVVDVRAILESSLQMAMHEIAHRARVVRELGDVPPVEANEGALGQVFLNLLVNAAQSIPEGGASGAQKVRVVTRTDESGNAVVEVHDTGSGIPPEVLPRIFDPFFTSAAAGEGRGLGLSVSHGTISRLGGRIVATSKVGAGSCLRVVLPPAKRWRSSTGRHRAAAIVPDRRRVLVVDDDRDVAEAIARVLRADADVELLTEGKRAIERLVAGERWDVVFCDLMMPGCTGMDLYAACVERAPDALRSIVFMTGGTFTVRARAFVENVSRPCLEKPLDTERIREIVRRGSASE